MSHQERTFLEIINNFEFTIVILNRIMKTPPSTTDFILNLMGLIRITIKNSCNRISDYFKISDNDLKNRIIGTLIFYRYKIMTKSLKK